MAWLSRNFIYNNTQSQYTNVRCREICRGCVEALIRTGWLLDLNRHTGLSDIKEYGTGANFCCWYYMKSRQGAKLLVFYSYQNCSVPYLQVIATNGVRSTTDKVCDLCLAIIPPGSNSEFGTSPELENPKFIPDDSTYLAGDSSGSSKAYNVSGNNEWTFISDGETIAFFSKVTSTSFETRLWYSFIIGRLFDILSDPVNDTLSTAKYGIFGLKPTNRATNWNYNYFHTIMNYSSSNYPRILSDNAYNGAYYSSHSSMCFLPDGTRFSYPTLSSTAILGAYTVFGLFYPNVNTSYNNGLRRWLPIYGAICQQSPDSGQTITPGDGFKGVYNTNLMRCVSPILSYNQLLDNGNWIYVGGGLIIAWDPSNIVLPCTINTIIDTRDVNNN